MSEYQMRRCGKRARILGLRPCAGPDCLRRFEVITANPNRRYCSRVCAKRAQDSRIRPTHCACGEALTGRSKKYCETCRRMAILADKRNTAARRRQGNKASELGSPSCPACGRKLSKYAFGSNPVTGVSTVTCPGCGTQPVVVRVPANFHRYDQRARLEAELVAKQERAEAPIQEVA